MVKNCLLLFAAFLSIVSTGRAQQTTVDSFMIDGRYRSYRFHSPATIVGERPLILNLHGFTSNALQQEFYSGFNAVADTAGLFVVYPEGTSINGLTFWDVDYPGTPEVEDVKFLSVLIDTLTRRYPVDRSRVYATGMSNGGYMAHLLGIRLNNKIAAVASVTGTMTRDAYAGAMPGRAVPAMQIHGTADGTVNYNGDQNSVSVDTLMGFWVRNNGCNPIPVKTSVADLNANDGCTADHFVWSGGANGTTVELFRVNGGGHTWPGSPFIIGVTNQDFSASQEIWRFFNQHRLQQQTTGADGRATGFKLHITPNPAKDILRISDERAGQAVITDMSGRRILQSSGKQIDVSSLPVGVYQLQYISGNRTATASFAKE